MKISLASIRFNSLVTLAVAILGALLVIFVNEGAYRQSKSAMDTLVARGAARTAIQQLTENLINAEFSQRAYVATGLESPLQDFSNAKAAVQKSISQLTLDFGRDPIQRPSYARLQSKVESHLEVLERGVALRRDGKLDEAYGVLMQNDSTMKLIQSLDNEVIAIEDEGRQQRRDTVYNSLLIARIGVTILILLGLGMFLLYLRQARALRVQQHQLNMIEQAARARLEAEVLLRTAELTDLSRYLLVNREDERSRLARNLHDDLGGLLTSAKLDIARLKTRMVKSAPDSLDLLAHLATTLNSCVALGRNIIENLRPSALDNLGLAATLEILTNEFGKSSGIETRCELEPVALSNSAELMVYRVVQEALTNTSRYAKASQVIVSLRVQGNQIQLIVSDNGSGFDATAKRSTAYGLLGMRFRVEAEGGTLSVISSPGNGTRIMVTVTLPAVTDAPALR